MNYCTEKTLPEYVKNLFKRSPAGALSILYPLPEDKSVPITQRAEIFISSKFEWGSNEAEKHFLSVIDYPKLIEWLNSQKTIFHKQLIELMRWQIAAAYTTLNISRFGGAVFVTDGAILEIPTDIVAKTITTNIEKTFMNISDENCFEECTVLMSSMYSISDNQLTSDGISILDQMFSSLAAGVNVPEWIGPLVTH